MEISGTIWIGYHADGAWIKFEHGSDEYDALAFGCEQFGIVAVKRENGAGQYACDARAYPALDTSAYEAMRARPDGALLERRGLMVYANRARSAELRKRQWSPTALNALAFHSFALSMDKDGDALIRAALIKYEKEQARYRVSLIGPLNPRREWVYAYACARIDARHSSR